MTDCTEYEVLLSTRLDGELTRSEAARLDAHLSACPSCQALAAELEALHTELGDMAPIPPASLAEGIMEQVRAEAKTIPFPAKPERKHHWNRYGALAAVLALVIVGGSFAVSPFSPFHAAGSSAPDMETAAVTEDALSAEASDAPEEAVPAEEMAVPPTETADAGESGGSPSPGTGSSFGYSTAEGEPAPAPVVTEQAAAEEAAPEAASEGPFEMADLKEEDASESVSASKPLSEAQARSLLSSALEDRGGSWTIVSDGEAPDGTGWLFTASDASAGLSLRFSVSLSDGTLTQLPPSG